MIKFLEKWSAALVFAILLHLAAFFVFYVNTSKNNIAHSKKTAANHIVTTSVGDDYPPIETQAYINTFNTKKSVYEVDNNRVLYLDLSNKPIAHIHENKSIKPIKNSDTGPFHPIKAENTSKRELQKNDKITDKERTIKIISVLSPDNGLEKIKYDVVLLNIDTPIHDSKPKIDREYDLLKAEIEENNNQLSKAINEVKKRNQQKIEEIQKQQANTDNYIYNNEYK